MGENEEAADLDPRFPGGMNYLDWLMNVLSADELTAKNVEEIVDYLRGDRASYEATGKVKKSNKITGDLLAMVKKNNPKPKLVRRGFKA